MFRKDPVSWLWPPIASFREGLLKVSELHSIKWFESGAPNGIPVCVLHGGPGGGSSAKVRQFFDPRVYRIVQHDQRGCGQSTPFACIVDNTTHHLVQDIEKLREFLNISKWHVFGGSWGSTLALAYSQAHPERVVSLSLRGIFAIRKREIDWFYQDGASFIFPEAWAQYYNHIPEAERSDLVLAYHKRLTSPDKAVQLAAARAWTLWEGCTSHLITSPDDLTRFEQDDFALAFASIENHYFHNRGFFPRDGFLLEEAQLAKIRHIPTSIVQGRYDCVCPIETAVLLSKGLPNADFVICPSSGHSMFEPEISRALVAASEKFASIN